MPRAHKFLCLSCCGVKKRSQLRVLKPEQYQYLVSKHSFDTMRTDAVSCPKCQSTDVAEVISVGSVYNRGYGFRDRKGVRLDQDLYQLDNNDPYSEHRVAGEKDHLSGRLARKKFKKPKITTIR